MIGRVPDLGLLATAEVSVIRPVDGEADPFGAPVRTSETETVSGVLPQPGSTSDGDTDRPDGVSVDMTFHFPRGYGKSLRGCSIAYGGRVYRVVGDPQPYLSENAPGGFDLEVGAVRADG